MAQSRRKALSSRQVQAITKSRLQALREFRALGENASAAVDKQRQKSHRKQGGVTEFATAQDLSRSRIDQATQFARLYADQEAFDALCELRTPQDLPLAVGHVIPTLSLTAEQRQKLLETAAAEGWSVSALRSSVPRNRAKRRSEGGRPPRRPVKASEALVQLVHETDRWMRFWEDVWFGETGLLTSPSIHRGSKKLVEMARTSLAALIQRAKQAERLLDEPS